MFTCVRGNNTEGSQSDTISESISWGRNGWLVLLLLLLLIAVAVDAAAAGLDLKAMVDNIDANMIVGWSRGFLL